MSDRIAFKNSIAADLLKIAAQFPTRAALCADGLTYSYETLFNWAHRIADGLRKHPDTRCLILAPRNSFAYASLLGALLAGKAYVFLNNKDSVERLQQAVENLDSALIIADESYLDLAQKLAPLRSSAIISPQTISSEVRKYTPKKAYRFAYLMLTSGSTGEPKAVAISHQNLFAYLRNIRARAKPTCRDRIAQISELSFDFSVHDIFLAWTSGACLCVSPDQLLGFSQFMLDEKISCLSAVPSTIRVLNQLNRQKHFFPSLRYTALCGEILSDAVARAWHCLAPNSVIDNLYGPTEATVAISAFRWTPEYSEHYVSIGEAFSDQEILLLNEEGQLAAPEEIGEMYLLGSQVAKGYWCAKKLSAEKFFRIYSIKHGKKIMAYRTGDLAYCDTSQRLFYKGRCDDQLKLRGYRVEKMEIELRIQQIAQTEVAAIVPQPFPEAENLSCFIGNSPFQAEDIIRRCRQELPDYMVPNRIITLLEFPYNKNGKLDYRKLKELSVLESDL